MIDLLYYLGAAAVGALIGAGVASLLSKYLDKAKEWFNKAWHGISRVSRAVGILVRRGNRLFKRFVAQLFNDEVEEYYDENDDGVEIKRDELSPEALQALDEDDYLLVETYGF